MHKHVTHNRCHATFADFKAEFTRLDQPGDESLGDTGFVYASSACAAHEACRLHIALHGCKQSFSNIGQDFVQHAGYNEWADSNHIVVLYPQTQFQLCKLGFVLGLVELSRP